MKCNFSKEYILDMPDFIFTNGAFCLSEEMQHWLREHKIYGTLGYFIDTSTNKFIPYINISNKEQALMFKLKWS